MISIFIALLLLATLYVYSTRNFNYWKKKGVKHDKPIPIFGNNAPVYFMQKSPTQLYSEIYKKYPGEKAMGFFRSNYPELLVRDPEIIKRILVSDFNHFYLRVVLPTDEKAPLADNLFNMNGDQWRLLRQRLTPAFTSGKLKAMFPLIVERAERLHTRIQAAAGAPIDARDLMARFTTDFIGACGFGLDMDALSEEESEFRKLGERLGLMQSLAGLAAVLSKFTVEPAPTSQLRPVFESKPVIVQAIKGGLPLVFRERKRM